MKLYNKPEKDDVEFFGWTPAFIMANVGKFIILKMILIIIVAIWLSSYVSDVGLKTIFDNIWYGA